MTTAIIIVVGWIACGVADYLLYRRMWRRKYKMWMKKDRTFTLLVSVFGPAALIATIIKTIEESSKDNEPASW